MLHRQQIRFPHKSGAHLAEVYKTGSAILPIVTREQITCLLTCGGFQSLGTFVTLSFYHLRIELHPHPTAQSHPASFLVLLNSGPVKAQVQGVP